MDKLAIVKESTTPANYNHVKNVQLAVNDKSDSLARIKKQAGEKTSLGILKIWLINLNDFLNISRKMTPDQIDQTVELIQDEFYYLKISDIALIFKRIKTGHYGEFYESIDGMKIMSMFYKYSQERMDFYIEKNEREHNEYKY
jgi:hypothetical protein